MPIPRADHLDIARCVEVLGEYDLREATTTMSRCLFHVQLDLLLATWNVRMQKADVTQQLRTDLRTMPL